jgi:tetratricopeptide (TPR) repeat protein
MNFNNYVGMASAHEVAGRYDEAIEMYRRALQERPHADWILRGLVSALAGAERMDEAAAAFKDLMAAYPELTVTKLKKAMVFSPAMVDRMSANLMKVGLPGTEAGTCVESVPRAWKFLFLHNRHQGAARSSAGPIVAWLRRALHNPRLACTPCLGAGRL